MSMYDDYTFEVRAVHPSGLISYESGRAKSTRRFLVLCEHAEEFALRMLGKLYRAYEEPFFLKPVLPAPFPQNRSFGNEKYRGYLLLVASSFSIEPVSACCFQSLNEDESGDSTLITNPTKYSQMETYFSTEEGAQNEECLCTVVINYEEDPCDCTTFDEETGEWVVHAEILPGTCVSTERNPAYEMFTLPNAGLVWKNVLDGNGQQVQLKPDSYAYKIIPKADIIVHWNNVPVKHLCQIESHLAGFRGTVNQEEWGDSILCSLTPLEGSDEQNPEAIPCNLYEPETILFIDWQEDRSKRTDCFRGTTGDPNDNMNTTTLKLFFKQKRVEIEFGDSGSNASVSDDDSGIAGWNHLFTDNEIEENTWMRVVVKSTGEPVFPLRAFSDILYPDPLE